jgi:hypothetical protein
MKTTNPSATNPAPGPLPDRLRVIEDTEPSFAETLIQRTDKAWIEWIRSKSAREIITEVISANAPRKWSSSDGYRFYFMALRDFEWVTFGV